MTVVPRAEGRVHICAAQEDEPLVKALSDHLIGVQVTHIGTIEPGEDLERRRRELIEEADLVVLLVSAEFAASEENAADAAYAVRRHEAEKARCVAVLARKCTWEVLRYAHLLILPHDLEPLITGSNRNDSALVEVAQWVREKIDPSPPANPFPGLRSFAKGDAAYYVGREQEIDAALDELTRPRPNGPPRWLLVSGPSGAGKSSFVRAGVVPRVLAGGLAGGPQKWVLIEMRPGQDPITNLAEALLRRAEPTLDFGARHLEDLQASLLSAESPKALALALREVLPKDHGVLLVIDQLEEAFTLALGNAPSVKQLDVQIAAALADEGLPLVVLMTLRSDFLTTMNELPELDRRRQEGRVAPLKLPWMNRDKLRAVIETPAARAGLVYDPDLAEMILRDACAVGHTPSAFTEADGEPSGRVALGVPGATPLVAHLLETLYSKRKGRRLTMEAYEEAGGVGGALARGADGMMEALGKEGRERARRLLLRLVTIDKHDEPVPQTCPRDVVLAVAAGVDEGEAADVAEAGRLLQRLSGGRGRGPAGLRALPGRLVAVSGDQGSEVVDLVHVALIQRWGTLRAWIKEDLTALKLRDAVEQQARIWAAHGKDPSDLPQGEILRHFWEVTRTELQDVAREFLFQANREWLRRAAEQRLRRVLWVIGLLIVLLILTTRAFLLAAQLEKTKRVQIQQRDMNTAAMFAGTMLSQLRALGDIVSAVAQERELTAAIEEGDTARLEAFCKQKQKLYEAPMAGVGSPFNLWFVLDRDGVALALSRSAGSHVGERYDWRDYYKGARALADKGLRSAYVSRAYLSKNEHRYGFALSVPVVGYNGQLTGVLIAHITSSASLGNQQPEDAESKTVLVAPRDRESPDDTAPLSYLILRYKGLADGDGVEIDNEQIRAVSEASLADEKRLERLLWPADHMLVIPSERYEDPMAKKDPSLAGNWLAGFAPVGGTGFVVVVQTPETEATRDASQFLQLARWAGIAGLAGTAIGLLPVAWRMVPAALRWLKKKLQEMWHKRRRQN